MKRFLACLLAGAAALAGGVAAQNTNDPKAPTGGKSDWELEQEKRNFQEADVALPPYPKGGSLIEIRVPSDTRFRFFVDSASLSSGPDGVVRYTLVARSPSGYDNVTYEGIRCTAKEVKVFALGDGGKWTARPGEWRPIEPKAFQRWHNELYTWFLCPNRLPVESAAEATDALRRGGHPKVLIDSGNSQNRN